MTSLQIEVSVAKYLNPRTNLIVPNVSWGANLHECDLLVITKSGYAWEVEIKVSKADLMRDLSKRHQHESRRIRCLYFAIPESLYEHQQYIPDRAGIITVNDKGLSRRRRLPKPVSDYKWTDAERFNIARLGSMRIWGLKLAILANTKPGEGDPIPSPKEGAADA